jgi:hypothetical protein
MKKGNLEKSNSNENAKEHRQPTKRDPDALAASYMELRRLRERVSAMELGGHRPGFPSRDDAHAARRLKRKMTYRTL